MKITNVWIANLRHSGDSRRSPSRIRCLFAACLALFVTAPAMAQYDYELFDHPGAPNTTAWGINQRGDVVGNGQTNTGSLPFIYDSKKGTYTDIAPLAGYDTAVLGIDDAGNVVGGLFDIETFTTEGYIRDKQGNFTVFSHPDALSSTNPRAVNNKGLVSGFRDRALYGGTRVAFIYDSKKDSFTDLIPEAVETISHGINSRGDVVGHSWFFGPLFEPCGNAPGLVSYSWMRASDGTVTYFTVNGERTRARGISDSGTIVGFTIGTGATRGFVVELDGSQCQEITIADSEMLEIPGYDTQPYGITNSGDIAGFATETVAEDPGFIIHGFIATPQ